jgi:hypothetical protein
LSSEIADDKKIAQDNEVITVADIKKAHDRILEEVSKVVVGRVDIITVDM